MIFFFVKRLLITILTLFLVSIVTFFAFTFIPGDAALLSLGREATDEQLIIFRSDMGLDKSLGQQYFFWLKNFFSGQLGFSSRYMGQSISKMILDRLPVTFCLAGLSFLFVFLISLPVSIISVKKETSVLNRIITALTALNISMPGFFLGLLFIWIFGVLFKLFIPGGYVSYSESFFAFLSYLIFPALAIALPNAAPVIKFLRSSIFREFKSDYARTAKSKGGNHTRILFKHIIKNASLPAITLLGMIAGEILSGSIVIEQVFGIPGIGRLLLASINARDYIMIQTLMIYIAFAVVFANTLADIVLQIIDPRIRLGERV